MVSSKTFYLSLLALLPISIAAPTPEIIKSSTEPIDWIPVDFNGKTLYVNSAALVDSSVNPARAVTRALHRRSNNDKCGQSSFNANDPPYASTGDCEVIRDWAYTQDTNWNVWDNTPDTHGLWYYNTCVFEAGTRNVLSTYIGSSDVGDVTRDALNIWQFLGQVAAKGNMGCENNAFGVLGTSLVNWQIKHS